MTSVMALDGVKSFLSWSDVPIHVNVCDTIQLLAGFPQCNIAEIQKKLKTSNVFSSFIVC